MSIAKQVLNTGTNANDGTGDSLRVAANKINTNFNTLFGFLGRDSFVSEFVSLDSDGYVVFVPAGTGGSNNTRFGANVPSSENLILLPDSSGEVILNNSLQTLNKKTLNSPTIDLVLDSNGNNILTLNPVDNAVNRIQISNGTASTDPKIEVVGDSDHIDIRIGTKGDSRIVHEKPVVIEAETLIEDGLVDTFKPLTLLNRTVDAATVQLRDSAVEGQVKEFINVNTQKFDININSFANGTSIELQANDYVKLIFGGSGWNVTSTFGNPVIS